MSRSKHKSLDLHGKTYDEADILIDEFIIKNIEKLPLEIITGNSVDMYAILKKIVAKHNLKLIPSSSFFRHPVYSANSMKSRNAGDLYCFDRDFP